MIVQTNINILLYLDKYYIFEIMTKQMSMSMLNLYAGINKHQYSILFRQISYFRDDDRANVNEKCRQTPIFNNIQTNVISLRCRHNKYPQEQLVYMKIQTNINVQRHLDKYHIFDMTTEQMLTKTLNLYTYINKHQCSTTFRQISYLRDDDRANVNENAKFIYRYKK